MKIKDNLKPIIAQLIKFGSHPYLVGGGVRDYLLKRPISDYDFEVYQIDASSLKKVLSTFGEVDLSGEKFGVYKVCNAEFALPRQEVVSGLSHQDFIIKVDPFMSPLKASNRRDFTINALLYDLINDKILDYHNGINDLKNRILKPVSKHFKEDSLRLLRACRFAAQLDFSLSRETVSYCKNMSLDNLSFSYLQAEVFKAFRSKKPQRFLDTLNEIKHFKAVFPATKYSDSLLKEAFFMENYVKMMIASSSFEEIMNLLVNKSWQKESYLWFEMSKCNLQRSTCFFAYDKSLFPLELSIYLNNKPLSYDSYLDLKSKLIKAEEVMAYGYKEKDIGLMLRKAQIVQIETGSISEARRILQCTKPKIVS